MSESTGRIVWHDLMSTDPAASEKFFTELFGWTVKEFKPAEGFNYRMIHVGETGIGGIVALEKEKGIPSHWISYVAVDSVDEAVKRAEASGGATLVPAMDIPNVGRFAVIQDPTGGCISPFESAGPYGPEPEGMPPAGHFCWEELLTTDPDRAGSFYSELFGYQTSEMDMGEGGTYTLFNRGESGVGGMMKKPDEAPGPSHWISYVAVDDVDAVNKKAEELGGCTYVPPRDIPDMGRFSVMADPSGAVFAVYKSASAS